MHCLSNFLLLCFTPSAGLLPPFTFSVLRFQVGLAGVNVGFAAREKPCNTFVIKEKSQESAGIPCKKRHRVRDLDPDQGCNDLVVHSRLWIPHQPLNELDQCCRSDILVLNACSVCCVFLRFPVLVARRWDLSALSTQRCDVSWKALGDMRGGCWRKEWCPDTHSSHFLASQSWMHTQLHGGSLVSTELFGVVLLGGF